MRKSWITSMLALTVIGAGSSVLSSPAQAAVATRFDSCGDYCPYYPEYSFVQYSCYVNSSGGYTVTCRYG